MSDRFERLETSGGASAAAGLQVLLLGPWGQLLGWSECDLPVLEHTPSGWALTCEAREAVLEAAPKLAGRSGGVIVRLGCDDEPVFGCLLRADELGGGLRPGLRRLSSAEDRMLALVIPSAEPEDRLARLLQESLALTPAEARLAGMLRDGGSLSDAADRLGVSVNTVRNQLRAVFDKLGVKRQSDLVRVLIQLSQLARALTPRSRAPSRDIASAEARAAMAL